jgi:hypothetical protein
MLRGSNLLMEIQRKNHKTEKIRKGRGCILFNAKRTADKIAKTLIRIARIFISGRAKK